jgi:MscS family membrane protein
MLVRNLFTRIVLNTLNRATERTHTDIDDRVLDALRDPIRFVPGGHGGVLRHQRLDVGDESAAFFYNVNRSLVAFTLFWVLYRLTAPVGTCC